MDWNSFWATFAASAGQFWMSVVTKVIAIVVVIALALLFRWILRVVIDHVVQRIVTGAKKGHASDDTQAIAAASPLAAVRIVQRTRTLGSVLGNIVNVLLFIVAALLIVTIINDQILGSFALLSAAIGAGLGFGAQNIVKDVLNGIFMVTEDQLGVGDVVDTGPATGVVESVGIRVTQIRDVNGTLWFVRNGEILRVGNMSQGWARVIIDLAVPYDADVDAVQAEMLTAAEGLAVSGKWRSRVLDKPEVWGLESISDDALVLRVVMKVRTSAKDDISRELRIRLKRALDEMGVKLPSLSTVVLSGFDGATSVNGSRPPRTKPTPLPPTVNTAPRLGRKRRQDAPAQNQPAPNAPAPEKPAPDPFRGNPS